VTAARFQPGDRMRARFSTPLLPAGTPGTVVAVYPTIRHAYEVRFDRQLASKLMWADELELADRPADSTPQP
jgi:hypothetical protein